MNVGMSTPGRRSGEEMPIGRSFPGLELARDLVEPARGNCHLAAHDKGEHLAAGPHGDIIHLLDVATCSLDDEAAQQVVGRTESKSAPADRARDRA